MIVGIVDSLMPQLMTTPDKLTSEDRDNIYTQSEKNNILSNVKRSLQDNIRFIHVTALESTDLNEIKWQQKKLTNFWSDTGLKLVNVYSEKKVKADELEEIDSLFSLWDSSINQEAWSNIKAEFSYNNINLVDFKSGEQFTSVVTSFIDNEIKNIGIKSLEESERTYSLFADSTWFKVILPKWIPYLLENKMLTPEQKKSIEAKIFDWKQRLAPASYDWVYILVAVLAVIGVGLMYRKRKANKPNEPTVQS